MEHFDQTMQGVTWEGTGWEVDPVRQQLTQELDEFEAQLRKGKVCLPGPETCQLPLVSTDQCHI